MSLVPLVQGVVGILLMHNVPSVLLNVGHEGLLPASLVLVVQMTGLVHARSPQPRPDGHPYSRNILDLPVIDVLGGKKLLDLHGMVLRRGHGAALVQVVLYGEPEDRAFSQGPDGTRPNWSLGVLAGLPFSSSNALGVG